MTTYRVTGTRRVGAPPRVAYDIIADYRDGHPRIIPAPWFRNIRVDSGGIGSGTTFRFDIHAFGATRTWRAVVSEPTPGHVLAETYPDEGTVTTFTVEPAEGGRACDVTIASEVRGRDGIGGRIERALMGRLLRRIFAAELELLEQVARERNEPQRTNGPAAA
jgi:polyketide cyclase/dehydrase/lipid transport protein